MASSGFIECGEAAFAMLSQGGQGSVGDALETVEQFAPNLCAAKQEILRPELMACIAGANSRIVKRPLVSRA